MTTFAQLPCPVCNKRGVEFDESDKQGRIWSMCNGPHHADTDMVTEMVGGKRVVRTVAIPDVVIYTYDIRNLLQANGRLMSHLTRRDEWLVRIVVDGKVLTLQSKPGLAEEK